LGYVFFWHAARASNLECRRRSFDPVRRSEMKALLVSMALGFGFVAASAAHAQAPAGAPAGSTGLCKDGTYYSGDSKKGACRGHKGVKDWYAGTAAAPAANDAAAPAEKTKKSKKDSAAAPAAAPVASTAKPADATGQCKDGTYTTGAAKKGACRGHKGVQDWYGATAAAPAKTSAPAPAVPAPAAEKKSSATTAAPASAAPAAAPAGATGLCKDGTYYSGDTKKGACRGHKGVKDWYGAAAAAPAKTSAPAPAAPAPAATAPKMTTPAAPAAPAAPASRAPAAPTAAAPATLPATPAAGGGNGKVWVNSETKVYHCQDDRYYGKTKQGEYMSEADAVAKGARPSHGKACAK
jgi:hypothetical protein